MTAPGSCMTWCRRRRTNSREGKMSAHSLRPRFFRMRFPTGGCPLTDERSDFAADFSDAREGILVMQPLVSMLGLAAAGVTWAILNQPRGAELCRRQDRGPDHSCGDNSVCEPGQRAHRAC